MSTAALAPIVLFVFRRPEHTARVLEALSRNAELAHSELIIYCEGARNDGEREMVAETRRVVRENARAGSVRIIERECNLGCAASILAGIDEVLCTHERIIVLEDDLIVSRYFLEYMNAALERYAGAESVLHVSGFMFKDAFTIPGAALFLPLTSSWGWATWRRAWAHFDSELRALPWLDQSLFRRFRFDLLGAFPYREMLDQYRRKEIDAWDIRWYLGFFRQSALAIFPSKSLVANIGFDDSGTHSTDQSLTEPVGAVLDARVTQWPRLRRSRWRDVLRISKTLGGGRSWRQRVRTLGAGLLGKYFTRAIKTGSSR